MNLIVKIALGLMLLPQLAYSDGSGLKWTVAVDLVGEMSTKEGSVADDKLEARGIELMAYAPIDHLFEGKMAMAAHPEEGVSLFEVHEASIGSSKLIPRSRFRLGYFFLGVGRLNQVHQHDWPFVSAPLVHAAYFDDEGVADKGVEYSVLLPLPIYLDLTLGVTNGFTWGHTHNEGVKPKVPTHYGRLSTFFLGTQWSLNQVIKESSMGDREQLTGVDVVYKKRAGRVVRHLLESEVWNRKLAPVSGEKEDSLGSWVFLQYGLDSGVLVGARVDYFTILSKKDAAGSTIANSRMGIVPTLTWKPSEFSTWRIAYEKLSEEEDGQDRKENHKLQFQMAYIIGAHPAHDF